MKQTILCGFALVVGAIALSWVLARPVDPAGDPMLASIPSGEARARAMAAAISDSAAVLRVAQIFPTTAARAALAGSLLRFHAVLPAIPVALGLVVLGGIGGALRRERVRAGEGYSSPLRAFVAKHAALAACAALAVVVVTPTPVGAWAFYAAAALAAAGGGAWIANLPVRL